MTTIWAQILIASKNILVGGNALHWFKIIAIINDVTASTCSLEKMGCTQKTIFRTSGTSTLLCACTFCFDMPWDFYHLSWNLPKSNSSVPSVMTLPLPCPPDRNCRVGFAFFPLFSCAIFILLPGLTGSIIAPGVPPPVLRSMVTLEGQAFMISQLDDYNGSISFFTKPPTSHWVAAAVIFPLFKISLQFLGGYSKLSVAF